MDTRLVKEISRGHRAHDFFTYSLDQRRRAVAAIRSDAPRSAVESALESSRLALFLARQVEACEVEFESEEPKRRELLASAPMREAPRLAPRVLPVPAFSEGVCLTHAPHAPPAGLWHPATI